MDSLLKKAKITCLTVLSAVLLGCGIKTYILLGHIDNLITKDQPKIEAVLENTNQSMIALHQTIGSLNDTVQEAKATVKEARGLIAKQATYQDAQNTHIDDVLTQAETALINFQGAMDDINKNQGKVTDAAIKEINNLGPLLEQATKTITSAGDTIADPNIKTTLAHLSVTMDNLQSTTHHLDHTMGLVDDKVTQAMRPRKPIVRIFDGFYRSLVIASELKGLF